MLFILLAAIYIVIQAFGYFLFWMYFKIPSK